MNLENILKLSYRDIINAILKDAPQNCTWTKVRDWVEKTYSQEEIVKIYMSLYSYLYYMSGEYETEKNEEEADYIRDNMTIFWYACNTTDLLEAEVFKFVKEREK